MCYNTHSVRVRILKTTTFHWTCGRATTRLSGCVVVSSFMSAPVVGVKVGGDAAAHPVFCLSNLSLPFAHGCLLNGTPLAARRPATARRLQAGAPTSHSRPRSVVVYQRSRPLWTNLGRLSFARIIPRNVLGGFYRPEKSDIYHSFTEAGSFVKYKLKWGS